MKGSKVFFPLCGPFTKTLAKFKYPRDNSSQIQVAQIDLSLNSLGTQHCSLLKNRPPDKFLLNRRRVTNYTPPPQIFEAQRISNMVVRDRPIARLGNIIARILHIFDNLLQIRLRVELIRLAMSFCLDTDVPTSTYTRQAGIENK